MQEVGTSQLIQTDLVTQKNQATRRIRKLRYFFYLYFAWCNLCESNLSYGLLQGNNIEVGPSIGNELNAGTTKKKPSKKNKNDNRVLVLCHNARSCHKLANPNPPTNPKKPSNKKNKEAQVLLLSLF